MMNIYIILCIIAAAVAIALYSVTRAGREKRRVHKKNTYVYTAKPLSMTPTEAQFFRRLEAVAGNRYYVFPQVHLSALLDYRVKGQDWGYAFRHINGKSVDYVLCDRETLRPVYAIELDDFTHAQKDRRARDSEVERMFMSADMPLIRFDSAGVSDKDMITAFTNAHASYTARS